MGETNGIIGNHVPRTLPYENCGPTRIINEVVGDVYLSTILAQDAVIHARLDHAIGDGKVIAFKSQYPDRRVIQGHARKVRVIAVYQDQLPHVLKISWAEIFLILPKHDGSTIDRV